MERGEPGERVDGNFLFASFIFWQADRRLGSYECVSCERARVSCISRDGTATAPVCRDKNRAPPLSVPPSSSLDQYIEFFASFLRPSRRMHAMLRANDSHFIISAFLFHSELCLTCCPKMNGWPHQKFTGSQLTLSTCGY